MSEQSDDYDSTWKKILETYFRDFVTFFFPVVSEGIDWSKGHTFEQGARSREHGVWNEEKME